jgi:hypothetical protein
VRHNAGINKKFEERVDAFIDRKEDNLIKIQKDMDHNLKFKPSLHKRPKFKKVLR